MVLRIRMSANYIIIFYILSLERLLAFEKITRSIEELNLEYDDEKNSAIAISDQEESYFDDFYDEFDNQIKRENSMDMIFFGPASSFLRLDAETILHIFMNTRKHLIPISKVLLAWDIITDGKTAAFLQGRELLAFGDLLNVVPEEDLYYINFGDPSVFQYFSNQKVNLNNRKFGVLVAAYRRYFGNQWYLNGSTINDIGYLLCGFPSSEIRKIPSRAFLELNADVLSKLDRCSVNQTRTLYNIATRPDAYGQPYEWSSHKIGRLNTLIACIPGSDISSIELEAINAISPIVMKRMSLRKLQYFTKEQILRMNPRTRRIYILRMQLMNSLDTNQIVRKKGHMKKPNLVFAVVFIYMYFNFIDLESLQFLLKSFTYY